MARTDIPDDLIPGDEPIPDLWEFLSENGFRVGKRGTTLVWTATDKPVAWVSIAPNLSSFFGAFASPFGRPPAVYLRDAHGSDLGRVRTTEEALDVLSMARLSGYACPMQGDTDGEFPE
jgi:hypothetical protein